MLPTLLLICVGSLPCAPERSLTAVLVEDRPCAVAERAVDDNPIIQGFLAAGAVLDKRCDYDGEFPLEGALPL